MRRNIKQQKSETADAQNVVEPNRSAPRVLSHEDVQSYVRTGEVLGLLLIRGFSYLAQFASWAVTSLTKAGRSLVRAIIRGQQYRAAIRQLQIRDDQVLKDIGVRRIDIAKVVEGRLNGSTPSAADTTPSKKEMVVTEKMPETAANDEKFESAA